MIRKKKKKKINCHDILSRHGVFCTRKRFDGCDVFSHHAFSTLDSTRSTSNRTYQSSKKPAGRRAWTRKESAKSGRTRLKRSSRTSSDKAPSLYSALECWAKRKSSHIARASYRSSRPSLEPHLAGRPVQETHRGLILEYRRRERNEKRSKYTLKRSLLKNISGSRAVCCSLGLGCFHLARLGANDEARLTETTVDKWGKHCAKNRERERERERRGREVERGWNEK